MSDLVHLLRACKADPDDDLPRLVLADWLDEHDQNERATFARLRCAPGGTTPTHAYRLGGCGTSGPWRSGEEAATHNPRTDEAPREREEGLFPRNRERWLGRPAGWFGRNPLHRGLLVLDDTWDRDHRKASHPGGGVRGRFLDCLTGLTADEAVWVESLRVGFDSHPGVTLRELSGSPLLGELARLSFGAGDLHPEDTGQQGDPLPREEVRALLAAPHLPWPRRPSFAHYAFTPDDIAALVAAPWFGQLTDLSLTGGWAGRSLCRHLAARPAPAALVCLRIQDVSQGLDDAAVERLCQATCLTSPRELDLSSNRRISDRGLQAVADSPLLGRLRPVEAGRGVFVAPAADRNGRIPPRGSREAD